MFEAVNGANRKLDISYMGIKHSRGQCQEQVTEGLCRCILAGWGGLSHFTL